MTPEQQRIAIAEACGWKGISHEHLTGYAPWRPTPYSERVMGDLDSVPLDPLPDYLNNLNAMHEAERVCIGTIHASKHGKMLQEVTNWHCVGIVPDYHRDLAHLSKLSRATAAQRAEAFLKTLNLWK